ncbi:MAG: sugar phosphate isomerase/epimerase, partial [Thermodesulfobacteriota bacterium]
LENMFPRSGYMYRPEEFSQVLAAQADLRMTLDLGHANIQAPPDRLARLVEAGGHRIAHVHVSDNTGADDEHLPVGVGRVDVAGGLKALKALGYQGRLTLEVFAPDRDYLALSLAKVKAMWEAA